MRLSSDKNDPAYTEDPFANCRIFCDGKEVRQVVTVDTAEGLVKYVPTDDGVPRFDKEKEDYVLLELRGKVEIEFADRGFSEDLSKVALMGRWGFPVAVADAETEQVKKEAAASLVGRRMTCIYWFNVQAEEFDLVGAYSKVDEADAEVAKLKAEGYKNVGCITMTFREFEAFYRDRVEKKFHEKLDALYEQLQPILKRMQDFDPAKYQIVKLESQE